MGETRRTLIDTKTDPELLELLEKVKNLPPMTREEQRQQRRSWVRGEMLLEHPEMTADQVNALMDKVDGLAPPLDRSM